MTGHHIVCSDCPFEAIVGESDRVQAALDAHDADHDIRAAPIRDPRREGSA